METISSTILTSAVTAPANLAAAQTVRANINTAPQAQPQSTNTVVSEKEVQQAIAEVASSVANTNESIGFSYEKKLGQLFVLVTDNVSGEVIREVPSKDFIKHKLAMQEMIGLLLDKQV